MSEGVQITFTVFTKPWKMGTPELAEHVASLGFDGLELPVRPGYAVTPDNAGKELPAAVRVFADHGLKVASIASVPTQTVLAACQEAKVPILRVMADLRADETYLAMESRVQREYDALVPLLERYGVTLGVQNHIGRSVSNAQGLRALVGKYDRRRVAAIWDAAHNALEGEEPELALDIVWDRLCMVNLKNAFKRRANGPEADVARWEPYWTTGPQGFASWRRVADELKRRSYRGVVCLTAEYTDEPAVNRLVAQDLVYARSLFA